MSETPKNQGEGNRDADRQYRDAAKAFAKSGKVEPAAQAAVTDEEGGKVVGQPIPASKDDPKDPDVLPSFWTERQDSAWGRVKEALHRDWLQTKQDIGMKSGEDLHQNIGDTVKQAVGKQAIPNGAQVGLDWDLARQAIRLGYGAATYWDSQEFNDLEPRLRSEWFALGGRVDFEQALPLVRHGWEQGRKDMKV